MLDYFFPDCATTFFFHTRYTKNEVYQRFKITTGYSSSKANFQLLIYYYTYDFIFKIIKCTTRIEDQVNSHDLLQIKLEYMYNTIQIHCATKRYVLILGRNCLSILLIKFYQDKSHILQFCILPERSTTQCSDCQQQDFLFL